MDETKETTAPYGKKKIASVVFAFVGIIAIVSVYFYVQYKSTHISTDDAFVEGRIHTISSRVPGTVKNVLVADNQFVKKGELLVGIDESDYDVLVSEAGSGLHAEQSRLAEFSARAEVAKRQLSELRYRVNAARANLELQQANLRQAEADI
ncbi:MAG: biotin/lipoyl-binding protein, partial [Nitrospirota bacterium]|nr:biotin/lipoyl-binding protein [Nitrospirota bacterium]